jgi:hypothetical protein
LLDLLRRLRRRPPDVTGITLERAAILKVLCDAYLTKQFEAMAMKTERKPRRVWSSWRIDLLTLKPWVVPARDVVQVAVKSFACGEIMLPPD